MVPPSVVTSGSTLTANRAASQGQGPCAGATSGDAKTVPNAATGQAVVLWHDDGSAVILANGAERPAVCPSGGSGAAAPCRGRLH